MPTSPILRNSDGSVMTYAWPGGYPILYITDDGAPICPDCVENENNIHTGGDADGWRIDGNYIHWEGEPEVCSNCNKAVESAYGVPDVD